jgi:uracil-DNA glycosylase family 4
MNIEELRHAVTIRANAVGLDVHCANDGMVHSTIAVISEYPGDTELRLGRPLVGGSGNFLWTQLRPYNILRHDVYITNVVKRKVDTRGDNKEVVGKHELAHWRELLMWELSQLPNLKYILVAGTFPLQAVCGLKGITEWRGSILPVTLPQGDGTTREVHVLVCNNPAAILREPKNELAFRLDMHKFKVLVDGRYKPHVVNTHINPTLKEALDFIRMLRADRVRTAYDIEIISGETACFGLANSTTEAMCINLVDEGGHHFTPDEEVRLRYQLAYLFSDQNMEFVAQNGMFDMTWMWYKDKIRVHANAFDTMLAHHTLYPGLPHNLGFLTTQYTYHPYYKNEKDDWRHTGGFDNFWRYNGKDCCITLAASFAMNKELRDQHLDKFFYSEVMPLQKELARLTVGGLLVDTNLKQRLNTELSERVDILLRDFHSAVQSCTGLGDYFPNPNSPRQMGDLFFNKLRLVGRGTSTNAENRELMFNHPRTSDSAREVIRRLDEYATERKFLSTYVEVGIDPDNRIRCEYKQTGVQSAPGRLSSSSVMWGSGMNLQNQPERAYSLFLADEGYCYVYFDLSQAEARVVGWKANIQSWIEQFERARIDGVYDCHRALASTMFDVVYDEVPTKDRDANGNVTIRYIAKRCRHGLNYRMQAARLARTTGLSMQKAQEAFVKYHQINPELAVWWRNTEKEVKETGELFNAYGRRWKLLERLTPEALESIVAFYPQSTIGDKVSRTIRLCHTDPAWPSDARIALNIHDALIALVPLEKHKLVMQLMKKHAEEPIVINGRELIIPAEFGVSQPGEEGKHRWSTIKKVKNEYFM